MNIDHLALFIRIASTQNIRQAGEELGLSAAVASSYLQKLEENLGTRLVHRTTRKVALTEEGHGFLPHAQDILDSIENARYAVGAGQAEPQGLLRVTAPASFARQHLITPLVEFMQQHPKVRIDLSLSDSIVDLVEGGFDLAIRNAKLKDSNLIARKLAKDRRMLCASPDYIAQRGSPSYPEDLQSHECVNLRGLDSWQFTTPEGPLSVKVTSRFKTDNGEAMRDACVAGLGIAINSTWNVWQHLKRGELIPVLSDYPLVAETAIWALYPTNRQLAPKVRRLIDFLSEWFGDEPYWDKEV